MKTVHDLLEDAKRRTILLCIWVLGLSYLMSLTSHSIWINIPVALLIIAMVRSLSGEIQIRWRTGQSSSPPTATKASTRVPRFRPHSAKDTRFASGHSIFELWRLGIEAPEVEAALEEITKSAVNEWVTSLWFRSLSPDQEFPDELGNLINNVFAELARRVKRINLITLLTQDIVDLVSSHLELFRRTQARVGADILGILSSEERDENLKQAMAAAGELHPALVSAESEYKVLHKLMEGLVAIVLRPEEGNCRVARTLCRELLACAVMRPVMNLLNPGLVNTLIENAVARNIPVPPEVSNAAAPARRTPDRPTTSRDTSERGDQGLEMVVHSQSKAAQDDYSARGGLKSTISEASLMRMGASGDMSGKLGGRGEVTVEGQNMDGASGDRVPRKLEGRGQSGNYGHQGARDSKENWAQLLEVVNQRKTLALAPEHLDNLWAKGRNYKRKEHGKPSSKPTDNTTLVKEPSISHPLAVDSSIPPPKPKPDVNPRKLAEVVELQPVSTESSADSNVLQSEADLAQEVMNAGKVLEKEKESATPRPIRKSRSIGAELDGWQALAHPGEGIPSLLQAGDGVGLGPGFELDLALRKRQKGKQSQQLEGMDSAYISTMLRCNQLQVDVVGAHFEKSGSSKTFAVYSVFVTDLQNRTWEVQRRFRNFEQLHRSLKDKPYYNLCLPAKRFLSSNLDNSFIRQRCALLDKYLKDLLAIPSIAELHEVWDFLSANSQTYAFGESPSMFKTLTSNVDDAVDDMFRQFRGAPEVKQALVVPGRDVRKPPMVGSSISPTTSHLPILTNPSISNRPGIDRRLPSQNIWEEEGESTDGLHQPLALGWLPEYDIQHPAPLSSSPFGSEPGMLDAQRDIQNFEGKHDGALSEGNSPLGSLTGSDMAEDENLAIPPDWGPPKVSVPLLNLVDVIFELQGRGWIRRQVFWMAKQVLQLGMGDAIDDFLLGKIQELRREEVLAGGIRWLHRILWPDGVFLTKHPSRQANISAPGSFEQRLEAARRAGVVREIILDRAPAGLVSLIGRKQYQRCAKDLFFFLQSAVCLKQLTYSLLELLLLSAFPELQDTVLEVRNM